MNRYRIGIVGCGGASVAIHLPILANLANKFDIKVVCDSKIERASYVAKRYGIAKYFVDMDEIFSEELDIIAILTGNHEYLINKALDCNINVFTEKPISLDIEESKRLVAKADKLSLRMDVGIMRLYDMVLRKLLDDLQLDTISSGILQKYDGSDAYVRRAILPNTMKVYTFGQNEPPVIPQKLNAHQIQALKILLWSGTHLLTIICLAFKNVKVISCTATPDFSSITCLFCSDNLQSVILHIGDTAVPLYFEEAQFISQRKIATIRFSSPYLNLGKTKSIVNIKNDQNTETKIFSSFTTAFYSMWQSIGESFENRGQKIKSIRSCDVALNVEDLARKCVEKIQIGGI